MDSASRAKMILARGMPNGTQMPFPGTAEYCTELGHLTSELGATLTEQEVIEALMMGIASAICKDPYFPLSINALVGLPHSPKYELATAIMTCIFLTR